MKKKNIDFYALLFLCLRRERQLKDANSKKRLLKPELKARTAVVGKVLKNQAYSTKQTFSSW